MVAGGVCASACMLVLRYACGIGADWCRQPTLKHGRTRWCVSVGGARHRPQRTRSEMLDRCWFRFTLRSLRGRGLGAAAGGAGGCGGGRVSRRMDKVNDGKEMLS